MMPTQITLNKCLNAATIQEAALFITTKVAFNRSKGYTTSTDNETFWRFAAKLDKEINKLNKELNRRNFKFGPLKKIRRNMKGNKWRDIYIPCWRDKIVERWLNVALNRQLKKYFSPQSFAYRLDFGLEKCQIDVANKIKTSEFIAKRDISAYFYSIDHDILLSKLSEIIDPNDFLFEIIKQRIIYEFIDEKGNNGTSNVGIPFGTSFACLLANVFLTDLDDKMNKFNVGYIRYADDFLIAGNGDEFREAVKVFDEEIIKLNLNINASKNVIYETASKPVKFLGLNFTKSGVIRLSVEKQRKVVRFFKRAIDTKMPKIRKSKPEDRVKIAIAMCKEVLMSRIRSIAIIDYYLKYINDEHQLKLIDRLIIETVLMAVHDSKKFKKSMFKVATPSKLRELGLPSLLHRSRLVKHGHIKVSFMSLYEEIVEERFHNRINSQNDRINKIKLYHKIKKLDANV